MEQTHNYSIHATRYDDNFCEKEDVYRDSCSERNTSPLWEHHLYYDSSPHLLDDEHKSFKHSEANVKSSAEEIKTTDKNMHQILQGSLIALLS